MAFVLPTRSPGRGRREDRLGDLRALASLGRGLGTLCGSPGKGAAIHQSAAARSCFQAPGASERAVLGYQRLGVDAAVRVRYQRSGIYTSPGGDRATPNATRLLRADTQHQRGQIGKGNFLPGRSFADDVDLPGAVVSRRAHRALRSNQADFRAARSRANAAIRASARPRASVWEPSPPPARRVAADRGRANAG